MSRSRARTTTAAALLILLVGTAAAPPNPASTPSSAFTAATGWIADQQVEDGGFFRQGQGAAYSGGLAETLAVLGADAGTSPDVLQAALDRLAELGPDAATRPAYTGRIVMAVVAAGHDPSRFGGHDYVADLKPTPAGYWEPQNYANALAALGWLAAGNRLSDASVAWIRANQCASGGFGWQALCLGVADVDTTALTLSVLLAHGLPTSDPAVVRARTFLLAAQNDQGGFGLAPGEVTNANSTGLVLSAIAALGEEPGAAPWSRGAGQDPLSELLELQTPEGGFLWRAGNAGGISSYATVQAAPGVAGLAYPLQPGREECEGLPGAAADHGRGRQGEQAHRACRPAA